MKQERQIVFSCWLNLSPSSRPFNAAAFPVPEHIIGVAHSLECLQLQIIDRCDLINKLPFSLHLLVAWIQQRRQPYAALLPASRMHPQWGGRCFPSGIFRPFINRQRLQLLANNLQQRECKRSGYSKDKTSPILSRKRMEVGCIYLHEDSVPNMAGPRCCYFKKGKKKKEWKTEEVYESRDETATQQGSWSQTMQSRLSKLPDSPLLLSPPLLHTADSFSLQPPAKVLLQEAKSKSFCFKSKR